MTSNHLLFCFVQDGEEMYEELDWYESQIRLYHLYQDVTKIIIIIIIIIYKIWKKLYL